MHGRCAVAWALALGTFAGCLSGGDPSSAAVQEEAAGAIGAVHALREVAPFEVHAQDGTPLRGHVYLPDGEPPYATVLVLSPYWGNAKSPTHDLAVESNGKRTLPQPYGALLERNFALAFVSVRGTGLSGGCMDFGGSLETADTVPVVQGLAAQSWSNGNVGMYGVSYEGWVQYQALEAAPPALKAVVPVSGVIDYHSLLVYNGATLVVKAALHPEWALGTGGGLFAVGVPTNLGVRPPSQTPQTSPDHVACPNWVEDARVGVQGARDGDRTAWYEARDYRDGIRASPVPVFAANGMAWGEGHKLQFEGLWDMVQGDKRLMVGQWGHGGQGTEVPDFAEQVAEWFDRYLRAGPAAARTGTVDWQDDSMRWHVSDRWPPPATATTLHLSGDRLVANESLVEASARAFRALGTEAGVLEGVGAGECGLTHVGYRSGRLAEPVVIAGNFEVEVSLTSTMTDHNVAVLVYETTGGSSCPPDGAIPFAVLPGDLAHWKSLDKGQDFPVGTPTTVKYASWPFAAFVPQGHRIVAVISGGMTGLTPDAVTGDITVNTGPDVVSRLTLPVVEGELRFVDGT